MLLKSFAIVITTIGLIVFFKEIMKIRKCLIIDGTVSDYKVVQDSDGNTYKLQVEYTTSRNQKKTFTSGISSSSKPYSTGDTIKLLYDDNKEEAVGVLHLINRFLIPYILFINGISIIIFSIKYDIQLKILEWIHNL